MERVFILQSSATNFGRYRNPVADMFDGFFEKTTIAQCNRQTWFIRTGLTQPQLQGLISAFYQESTIPFRIIRILDSDNINNKDALGDFQCEGEAVHRLVHSYRESINRLR